MHRLAFVPLAIALAVLAPIAPPPVVQVAGLSLLPGHVLSGAPTARGMAGAAVVRKLTPRPLVPRVRKPVSGA